MKDTMRNKINLIFSSFLVIGYIVCTYFFSNLADQVSGTVGSLIQTLILVIFGLLLFYATRIGEGKQVKRFSIAVLLLLVLPCLYIVVASFASFLPFHDQLTAVSAVGEAGNAIRFQPVIMMLACVGLGYGIPYTFLSGYELKTEDDPEEEKPEEAVLEGGLAEELAEVQAEAEDAAEEADKADEAQVAAEEPAEEAAEASAEEEPDKDADMVDEEHAEETAE